MKDYNGCSVPCERDFSTDALKWTNEGPVIGDKYIISHTRHSDVMKNSCCIIKWSSQYCVQYKKRDDLHTAVTSELPITTVINQVLRSLN